MIAAYVRCRSELAIACADGVRSCRDRCDSAGSRCSSKGSTALKSRTLLTLPYGPPCFRGYARGMVASSHGSLHAEGITLKVANVIDLKDLSAARENEVLT